MNSGVLAEDEVRAGVVLADDVPRGPRHILTVLRG